MKPSGFSRSRLLLLVLSFVSVGVFALGSAAQFYVLNIAREKIPQFKQRVQALPDSLP
jgi:hypothetical protein